MLRARRAAALWLLGGTSVLPLVVSSRGPVNIGLQFTPVM